MRFLFWLSIALNLLLLTTIVPARVDSSRESVPIRTASDPVFQLDSSLAGHRDVQQISDLLEIIRGTVLGMDDIKSLSLGWLVEKYRSEYEAGPAYWQGGYAPQINALATSIALEQRVRDVLISVFGPSAADDPAFDSVFRPLGLAYAFLDSDAQLELQRRQVELLASRDLSVARPAPQLAACISEGTRLDRPPFAAGLPEQFGQSAAREYGLRFSPLAQQLRMSAVATNEREFRALFDQLLELERQSSPQAQARIRADLREFMGERDFDQLWSQRDPFFAAIEKFLVAEGFSDHSIQAAYSVINRSQEALLRLMGESPNPQSTMSAIGRIRQGESEQLASLLGDRAATGLSIAMSQAAVRLSGTSNGTC